MRGRKTKRTSDWRSQKRAMLRALLFAAVPMLTVPLIADSATAETPAANSSLVLPPLPLSGQAQTKGLQPNPFCQISPMQSVSPVASNEIAKPSLGLPQPVQNNFFDLSLSGIQLASGSDAPLTAVDNAETTVRLLPLPSSASDASSGQAGVIRPNPMVIHEPHLAPTSGAILLPVVSPSEKPAEKAAPSAKVLPPLVASPAVVAAPAVIEPVEIVPPPTVVAAEPTVAPPIDQQPVAAAGVTEPLQHDATKTPPVKNKAKAWKPTGGESQVAKNASPKTEVVEGPVSFSLNDMKLVETSDAEPQIAAKPATKPAAKAGASFADIVRHRDQPEVKNTVPAKGTAILSKATSESRNVNSTATIARGSAKTLLVPLDPVDDPKRMTPTAAPDKRLVKGSRPRVDVGVPPVAIERTSHNSGHVAVEPVAVDASSVSTQDTVFQSDAPVTIELKSTEVRSLKLDGNISKVQIGESTICAVIAAGPSQIQLIGARDGVTRLAVWTAQKGGQEQKTIYEVCVGATSRSTATEGVAIANTLTKSARAAFPTSSIQVRHEQGEMIVEGVCADNDSAKQVLRMIRSACKLPVVDKLTIR
jgi:hypothetical protein